MNLESKTIDEMIKDWEKRMKEKGEKEKEQEEQRTENLRQKYLSRTGRKEMKP